MGPYGSFHCVCSLDEMSLICLLQEAESTTWCHIFCLRWHQCLCLMSLVKHRCGRSRHKRRMLRGCCSTFGCSATFCSARPHGHQHASASLLSATVLVNSKASCMVFVFSSSLQHHPLLHHTELHSPQEDHPGAPCRRQLRQVWQLL